jgi:nicotinamide-nucleotide amidase
MNNELEKLSLELGTLLKKNNLILAVAESCTGGLLAKVMTDIAGSSSYFDSGFVVYSNQAKIDLLNVSPQTIFQFGAVSEETAKEMVVGVLEKRKPANLAVSITGVAGPSGGTAKTPLGTVCFGIQFRGQKIITKIEYFTGQRDEIRKKAVVFILKELIKLFLFTTT